MAVRFRYLIFGMIAIILPSCVTSHKTTPAAAGDNEKLLMAVAWYQHSAELEALCYQGFNYAQLRLGEAIIENKSQKPLAVVVDVDETMLDNSPFEAALITSGGGSHSWSSWTKTAGAKAIPGAVEFATFAESKNVEIFYVTNRSTDEQEATLRNLQNEGFPFADARHFLARGDTAYSEGNTSSKKARRQKVAETHEIVLLIGDNLNDFSEVFEDRSVHYGKDAVALNREKFGKTFIVLPNPMYGAWENPLIDYKSGLTESEKTKLIKSKLKVE